MADTLRLITALHFVAEAHANHRRKGAAQEPYINHLIEVADLVASATGGADEDLIIAALCHDLIEDPGCATDLLRARFGARVATMDRLFDDQETATRKALYALGEAA